MTSTNDETDPALDVSSRDLDEFFDLLAAKRRRQALYFLENCDDDWADIEEIVAYVSGRTPESGEEAITVDLHHNHLPRLEQAGVAEFDERSGTVRYYGHQLFEARLDEIVDVEGE